MSSKGTAVETNLFSLSPQEVKWILAHTLKSPTRMTAGTCNLYPRRVQQFDDAPFPLISTKNQTAVKSILMFEHVVRDFFIWSTISIDYHPKWSSNQTRLTKQRCSLTEYKLLAITFLLSNIRGALLVYSTELSLTCYLTEDNSIDHVDRIYR